MKTGRIDSGLELFGNGEQDGFTDFVQVTDAGSNSFVSVDVDGGGNNFVQVATLLDITGLTDEAALQAAGILVV